MKKQKARVQQFLEEMGWMFGINMFRRILTFKHDDSENEDGTDIAAEIRLDIPYQTITIKIYPCFFENTLDEQRKILLHEFCHVITLPSKKSMYDLLDGKLITPSRISDINEEATSRIEILLDKLLRNNLKYAQKAYKKYKS